MNEVRVLISHQIVATRSALPAQMTASIAKIMFIVNSHAIIESVATFPARQCHGSGKMRESAERKATGANSGCMVKDEERVVVQRVLGEVPTIFEPSSLASLCAFTDRGQRAQWKEVQGLPFQDQKRGCDIPLFTCHICHTSRLTRRSAQPTVSKRRVSLTVCILGPGYARFFLVNYILIIL